VITLHGMTIITANIQLETCPSDVDVGCGSFCLFWHAASSVLC
jgi:hypothetical protein